MTDATKAAEFEVSSLLWAVPTKVLWLRTQDGVKKAQQVFREELIAELGWNREDPVNPYLASSIELVHWCNEKRAKTGRPLRHHIVHQLFDPQFAFPGQVIVNAPRRVHRRPSRKAAREGRKP